MFKVFGESEWTRQNITIHLASYSLWLVLSGDRGRSVNALIKSLRDKS